MTLMGDASPFLPDFPIQTYKAIKGKRESQRLAYEMAGIMASTVCASLAPRYFP